MQKITDLEIIGYGNVLKESMLPSVVAPVFRRLDNRDVVIFPPYSFDGGFVLRETEGNQQDYSRLVDARQITRIENAIPAVAGHELWIDQNLHPQYEARARVTEKLRSIAFESIKRAKAALRERNFPETERFCGVALSADDRLVEPLAIKAAVARSKNEAPRERVMEKLASTMMTAEAFAVLVAGFVAELQPQQRPAFAGYRLASSPMSGIAAYRATELAEAA